MAIKRGPGQDIEKSKMGEEKGQKQEWNECGWECCLLSIPPLHFLPFHFSKKSVNDVLLPLCMFRCVLVCRCVLSVCMLDESVVWCLASQSHAVNNKNPWSYIKDFIFTHTHTHFGTHALHRRTLSLRKRWESLNTCFTVMCTSYRNSSSAKLSL